MTACLSDFALDAVLLESHGTPDLAAHLGECAACQARCEARRCEWDECEGSLGTSFWHTVVREQQRRRRRRWAWLGVPAVLALACALVFFVVRDDSSAVHWAAKGAPSLEVHCRRAARTFVLATGDVVEPGDELRFVPRSVPPEARYIQVASIDGTGRYTPFYPAAHEAPSQPLPPPGGPLPGSIRLDRAPGPERVFFVLSAAPLPVGAVREAAQSLVTSLRATDTINGTAIASGWLVLPKNLPVLP